MFSIKELAFGATVVFVLGFVAGGSVMQAVHEAAPPAPTKAIPNLKATLDWLRKSKALYEYDAATAGKGLDLVACERKYGNTRAAFNDLVVEMRDSLWGIQGSKSPAELGELMTTADETGKAFDDWRYKRGSESRGSSSSEMTEILDPLGVITLSLQLEQMQEARDQNLRDYVKGEIEGCMLRSWRDVRGK